MADYERTDGEVIWNPVSNMQNYYTGRLDIVYSIFQS